MQTFLPYESFQKSAKCLDYKRLGKQRIEAWQIYCALTKKNYGWQKHPAVEMWKGYELALLYYGFFISYEWKRRGYKDIMTNRFCNELKKIGNKYMYMPHWLGNKKFHASMRSNLLRKDYEYYNQFKWQEKDNLLYYWPIKGEAK